MSDLPELNLFEEIQGIANSADYFTYTQDEFNKTWNYYEEESAMDTKEQDSTSVWRTQTPVSNLPPTPPSSGKSSPTRDAWDPMLWHTRSLEEVELRALAELGPLSPPLSPIVMTTLPTSCPCQAVSQDPTSSCSVTRSQQQGAGGAPRESRHQARGRPGESRHRKKAR